MTVWVFFPVGLLAAFLIILWARRYSPRGERKLYANGLIVAAAIYVVAGGLRGDAAILGIELIGLVLFSGMAVLGMRRAPMWLALGWLLHIGWDAARSLGGPEVMPAWYGVACLAFDLVIAAAILFGRRIEVVRA